MMHLLIDDQMLALSLRGPAGDATHPGVFDDGEAL
jgi:hypothetical protein